MTPYRKAVDAFRVRYFLGAVLDAYGNVSAAARAIGANDNLMRTVLGRAGFTRERIHAMVLDRARLNAGLPPADALRQMRKPPVSIDAAGAAQRIA